MTRTVSLLVGLLGTLLGGCTPTMGPTETKAEFRRTLSAIDRESWIVVNSNRFEIYSTLDEADTVALATELERFHALIYATTSAVRDEPTVPTRIFAFKDKSDYLRFALPGTAGWFREGMRTNFIVLTDYSANGQGPGEVIQHEYVHFVLRNGSSVRYPLWYSEGFAEFLSTARVVEGDQIAIGIIPFSQAMRLSGGRWIRFPLIIRGQTYSDFPGRQLQMFYAGAWALVHYLTLDRSEELTMGRDLSRYLTFLESGETQIAAFRLAFGESVKNAERRFRRMIKRGDLRIIGIPLANLDYDRREPVVRVPIADEIHVKLGQLALARGDGAQAEVEFLAAVALDPRNANAQAGLGDAYKLQNRYKEAETYFLRAVELDPADAFNHLDLAEYYHVLALIDEGLPNLMTLLAKARNAYARSLEIDPSITEATAMLGVTHLAPGEDPSLALAPLRRAYETMPSSSQIRAFLIETYIATNRIREARTLLRSIIAAHGSSAINRSIDERIETIRSRRSRLAERAKSVAKPTKPPRTESSTGEKR